VELLALLSAIDIPNSKNEARNIFSYYHLSERNQNEENQKESNSSMSREKVMAQSTIRATPEGNGRIDIGRVRTPA
jgi:hypothetical protein